MKSATDTNEHIAAAVGTVSARSLVEPLRKIVSRLRAHFVAGKVLQLFLVTW